MSGYTDPSGRCIIYTGLSCLFGCHVSVITTYVTSTTFMSYNVVQYGMMEDKVTVRFPSDEIEQIDDEVTRSMHFDDRSDLVRYAVRELLQREIEA